MDSRCYPGGTAPPLPLCRDAPGGLLERPLSSLSVWGGQIRHSVQMRDTRSRCGWAGLPPAQHRFEGARDAIAGSARPPASVVGEAEPEGGCEEAETGERKSDVRATIRGFAAARGVGSRLARRRADGGPCRASLTAAATAPPIGAALGGSQGVAVAPTVERERGPGGRPSRYVAPAR